MSHTCSKCGQIKPDDQFRKDWPRNKVCKACRIKPLTEEDKERMRAYYLAHKSRWSSPKAKEKNKAYRDAHIAERLEAGRHRRTAARKYVAEIKNRPCMDCGIVYPWYVMDLDHVRGEKLSDVSSLVDNGASLARLKTEIVKCDVVCSNCHRIRTHIFRGTAS
jgi:hypothetical protein